MGQQRWIPVLVNSMPRLAGDVQDVLGHKVELGEVRVPQGRCLAVPCATEGVTPSLPLPEARAS